MLSRRLLIVTATYERPGRLEYISRVSDSLRGVPDLLWIVAEDDNQLNKNVGRFLKKSQICYSYLAAGKTRDMGNTPKSKAFEYIVQSQLLGVVYVADDDNYYDRRLWGEVRKTGKVMVFPVGNLGPDGIERPVVENGKIVEWRANWKSRKYPLDWAGFSFSSALLPSLRQPFLGRKMTQSENSADQSIFLKCDVQERKRLLAEYYEGESEFIEKLIDSPDELEIGCDQCTSCMVWYNQPLIDPSSLRKGRWRGRICTLSGSIFLNNLASLKQVFTKLYDRVGPPI